MGFFSAIGNCISGAYYSFVDTVESVVDAFTGRDNYDRAKWKYEKVQETYAAKQKEYQQETERLNNEIIDAIKGINERKRYIQQEQFRRLVDLLAVLKDVDVPETFCEEAYQKQCRELDDFTAIKTKNSLFSIDFDKDAVKTSLKAFFTLGFATRGEARRTLERVEEQEAVAEDSMAQMDAEIEKQKACLQSVRQIEMYFEQMSNLFDRMLRYMEHAVHYVCYAAMRLSKKVAKKSVSIKLLHEKQQKELEATVILGMTMAKLVRTQIVLTGEKSNLNEYAGKIKKEYDELQKNKWLAKDGGDQR